MFDSGRGSLLGGGGPVSVVLPGPKLALNGPDYYGPQYACNNIIINILHLGVFSTAAILQQPIPVSAPTIWNFLSSHTRLSDSLVILKCGLKRHF